ncbi:hypothetical protein FSP39_003715, partial [Pinctada imbricata]
TGFGNELAIRLDKLGFHVLASCLDPKCEGATSLIKLCSKRLFVIGLDVSRDECVTEAHTEVTNKLKSSKAELWAVVNNAGIDYVADIELCSMEVYRKVAEVNLFGMIRVTKAFLPILRRTKGRVINVTSVKGRVCLPYISAYGITKYGGENFSDILRMEMKKFGVKVVIVEPGNFGRLTAIVKGKNLDRIRKDFDRTWSGATQDIKDTYGREYMFAHVDRLEGNDEEGSDRNVVPVTDAFVDAIMNENPNTRYLIDGSPDWIDRYCVSIYERKEGISNQTRQSTKPQSRQAQQET